MKTLFYLLALVLVIGCGARKSETSIANSESKSDIEAAAETNSNLQQHSSSEATGSKEKATVTETQKTTGKATPVNPDKPMEVVHPDGSKTTITNGTWETGYENTKTETKEKETSRQKDTAVVNVATTDKSTVIASVEEKHNNKAKATEKEQWNPFTWWAVAGLFIIALLFIKRRKDEKAESINSGELE